MKKTALVTGGSSGIGKATAEALAEAGYNVYEISRGGKDAPGIRHITADLCDEAAVQAAIGKIAAEAGRIDLAVNNAGFGISGAVEFCETADAKRLFNVDFFGAVRINRAVLPLMREAGGGAVIMVSSLAGAVPIPFQTYYSAAKAAVNAYTEALANEVRPFGIRVAAVQPGDIRTGFTAAREKDARGDDIYRGRITRSVAGMERDERRGMPPRAVAKRIVSLAAKKRLKPLYTVGFGYQCLAVLAKILPCRLKSFIVCQLYAK